MNPSAQIDIDAPLAVVWDVMTDTGRYGEWNPFVERAETAQPAAVGNPIVLHVVWANGRRTRSPERITALDGPTTDPVSGTTTALMSYVYEGLPARLGLVRGVRHQRLTQHPGGPTTYDTVEEFSGPLVRLAGPGRVADGFRRHAEGLRQRAEREASSRREG
ncbi:SRPBCC domain-containing protein [Nocardioides sp. QY071]|uniref:SRPBCC domain-containing protein n=1 Tax=Nocardioides sp. QY071 TaxID=3044187 RepID=UPI00249B0B4E|nr:SRPBCC domain-containing protein [Nocardioides sp. QY071]WGY02687.1 SRPBCC domain-containing protein [Nocardioides sp. QY071]